MDLSHNELGKKCKLWKKKSRKEFVEALKNGEQALMFRSGEHCFALSETVKSPFNLVSLMPTDPEHGLYPRLNVKQLITVLPIPKTDLVSVELCDRHLYCN